MNDVPKLQSYGPKDYDGRCMQLTLPGITIWFSYETPIAFRSNEHGRVVRQNLWGPTTGKHMKVIDGGAKSDRVNSETFETLLQEALGGNDE